MISNRFFQSKFKSGESHQCAPHRGPGAAQRRVPSEGGVHEAAHQTQTGARDLEDAEHEHTIVIKDEVPVPSHVSPAVTEPLPSSSVTGGSLDSGRNWERNVVLDSPGCLKNDSRKDEA